MEGDLPSVDKLKEMFHRGPAPAHVPAAIPNGNAAEPSEERREHIHRLLKTPHSIKDEDDLLMAGEIFKQIKAARAWVGEQFDRIIAATNQAHKTACAQKNDLDIPLKIKEAAIKDAIGLWHLEDKRRRAAEEKKIEKKYNMPIVMPTEAPKQAGVGVSFGWDWEVEDIDKIPAAYIIRTVNGAAIDAIVRAQQEKTVIAGIRIFEKANVSARKK